MAMPLRRMRVQAVVCWRPAEMGFLGSTSPKVIEGYEACDDGNQINTDQCTNACAPAVCGDGIIRTDVAASDPLFEVCDDGNQLEGDACLNDCTLASCGDGITRTDLAPGDIGYEQCDDGNTTSDDGCDSSCQQETGCQTDCPSFVSLFRQRDFSMGSLVCITPGTPQGCSSFPDRNEGDSSGYPHTVSLGEFQMTQTEITVGQYRECVDAGACELASNLHGE